jgi:hypothetical protein
VRHKRLPLRDGRNENDRIRQRRPNSSGNHFYSM